MKKPLFRRIILFYILFSAIGFVIVAVLAFKGLSIDHLTMSKEDLRLYFLNSYFLIFLLICLIALALLVIYVLTVYRHLKHMVMEAGAYAEGDYSTPLSYHGNNELGYLGDVMDCMAAELNSLESDQRKFISNVSHDFRSPLTSIKGYATAMADGTIPVEMQEKYLGVIVSETERLEKLTESILELNKYSDKGTYLDLGTFDINEMIRQTVLTFEGRASERGITFNLRLTAHPLNVRADSAKIDQVLHNLIDNALKFSHHDSQITISTKIQGSKAFVSVKDNGIGIPKESLSKIWERFYKTDLSRGKDKRGTGLGLAIVKEIIHAHHENINVISTQGVGTEFIFTLSLE